jgi:glucose 1-dehydrogenase
MKKVAEAGGRPTLVAADVSDEHAVEQMFDQVLSEYGRLDILINNAGIQIAGNSEDLPAADFDKVLAVNLRGTFLCARRAYWEATRVIACCRRCNKRRPAGTAQQRQP